MFEIDLKRSESQESLKGVADDSPAALARPFAPVAAALVGLLACFWAVNGILDRSIATRQENVKQLQVTLDTSRNQLADLTGKHRLALGVQHQEVYWSDQLRLLSEKLPDKVWINQVRVATTGGGKPAQGTEPQPVVATGLVVDGGVLSNPSEGNLDVIGKFVKDLQADSRFQQTFSTVTLESVRRTGDPYALVFQLNVAFKPQAG